MTSIQINHKNNTIEMTKKFYNESCKYGKLLTRAIERALDVVMSCTCGGDEAEASCYGCLRSYGNQRIHDQLKRSLAINYLRKIVFKKNN